MARDSRADESRSYAQRRRSRSAGSRSDGARAGSRSGGDSCAALPHAATTIARGIVAPGARRQHRAACAAVTRPREHKSTVCCADGARRVRRAGSGWAAHGECACGTRVGRQRTGSVVGSAPARSSVDQEKARLAGAATAVAQRADQRVSRGSTGGMGAGGGAVARRRVRARACGAGAAVAHLLSAPRCCTRRW